MWEKIFLHNFIHFFERVLNFLLHVLREAGRKIVTEPVFSMDSDFKAAALTAMLMSSTIAY